jgi:transposase
MSYSSDLTDDEWVLLEELLLELLPKKNKTKPNKWSYRYIINGIFYQLKNGCNWMDLPKDFPPYSTVYWHYKEWRKSDILGKLMNILHEKTRENIKKK